MRRQKKRPERTSNFKILNTWIHPDASLPHSTAIRNAFIKKFVDWYKLDPNASTSEMKRLEKEWSMLAALLFRSPPTRPSRDWRKLPTEPQIVRVLRHALRVTTDHRSKGRPRSDIRRVAVVALDLRHSDPERWSWRSLTDHLCNCGLREHAANSNCQKNLKREALLVKKSLQMLGIKLPPAK
jgi:hypothetical protein